MSKQTKMPKLWRDNLTHMLGAGSHIDESKHGYRNHFCASTHYSDSDYQSMLDMFEAGLVETVSIINNGTSHIFRATEAGCRAIGLSESAIERAKRAD